MKKYKSKISYWFFVPLVLVFFYVQISTIIYQDWYAAMILLGVNGLVISFLARTYYQIENDTLCVVSSFVISQRIALKSIRKIQKTKSLLSSPALSLTDRIEIFYDKYDSIIISPKRQKEFINTLKSINYEIEIAL